MKKALQMLLALMIAAVLSTAAAAPAEPKDEGLMLKDPIEGVVEQPESADAYQAAFLLRYQYPQFEAHTEADEDINRYYQALAQDSAAVAQTLAAMGEYAQADIRCEVSHVSDRYVSVKQILAAEGGNGPVETLSADTFARDGMYAGQMVTLSQILGLEEDGGLSDEHSMAEELVYSLVWQIVSRGMENAEGDYVDGLTEESLKHAFQPENSFYLDMDGNLVFFIQAGEIAGEIAGILEFPFAPAEILSVL